MNDGKVVQSNKFCMKMGLNNVFLSNNISHSSSQAQARNIFLSPLEEDQNRSKLKHRQTNLNTFSDFSADEISSKNAEKQTGNLNQTDKWSGNNKIDDAKEDDYIFNEISTSQFRKLGSHQSFQTYKNDDNKKQFLLSNEIISKIKSTNNVLKTFRLITKRKFRVSDIGKTSHFIFTDGEKILFNIYQNKQQPNLFEIYDYNQAPTSVEEKITANELKSPTSTKSQQIQTTKEIASANQSYVSETNPNAPVATLQMLDIKGSNFMFYKSGINGVPLLKIQYMKTNYSGYYRSTVVTFYKNTDSTTEPAKRSFSQPSSTSASTLSIQEIHNNTSISASSEPKKQRLWSKQPKLDADGKPVFSFPNNRFFVVSIRNMNLCKKDQDRIFLSIRKTDQDELQIDAFIKGNILWFVGISLSDVLSSIY